MNRWDLETERLRLKEIDIKDLQNIHRLNSEFKVSEFNTIGIPQSVEDTHQLLRPALEDQKNPVRSFFRWSITLKSTGAFIGDGGLSNSQNRFRIGEIDYSLFPDYWKNGYATEAVRRILEFGFKDLKLHRIEAGVATENAASIKVLEKVGMVREGRKRKILPIRGEWKDNYLYAILESD